MRDMSNREDDTMATLSEVMQPRTLAACDLPILAYALHMAQTARSDAARQLFTEFIGQERQRLVANGGHGLAEGRVTPLSKGPTRGVACLQ